MQLQFIEDKPPYSQHKRAYPPVSVCDTVEIIPGIGFKNTVPKFLCFQDEQIDSIRYRALPFPEVMKSTHGKTLLQQQSQHGSAAACLEMLLADRKMPIDWSRMRSSGFECTRDITRQIQNRKLTPIVRNVPFGQVHKILQLYGSAIICLDHSYSNHMVVLDKIDHIKSVVYIREPYHGWAVTIKLKAFYVAVGLNPELIQLQTK